MSCNPEVLKSVPLFSLLDEEETAVLASQVEMKTFAPRERIYKTGDAGTQAYVLVSGSVEVTTVDEDQQEVVVHEPGAGEIFGLAAMLEQTPHRWSAPALPLVTAGALLPLDASLHATGGWLRDLTVVDGGSLDARARLEDASFTLGPRHAVSGLHGALTT